MLRLLPSLAVFASTLLTVQAWAECDTTQGGTLAGIDVDGAEHTNVDDIVAAIGVEVGEELPITELTNIENAVAALGSFARVKAILVAGDEGGCRLAVTVEEYPLVQKLEFEGVTVLAAEKLTGEITTHVGDLPNLQTVQADAELIAEIYHRSGYDAAGVTEVDLTGGVVTFTIDEGRIVRVDVKGARRTGKNRVLELLEIREGDVYNSFTLHEAQTRLYRTGLFALVGFGTEVLGEDDGDPEGIALTVRVQEFVAPSFQAHFSANQSVTLLGASQEERNVRRGHGIRVWGDFEVGSPADLAGTGFDDFYHFEIGGEFRQFRPPWRPYNAVLGVEYDRTKRRERPDLGIRYSLDAPIARAVLAFPLSDNAQGAVAAYAGWFQVQNFSSVLPERFRRYESGAHGRAELSTEYTLARGLETPGQLSARAGVELTEGRNPFGYLEVRGRYGYTLPYGKAVLTGEAGLLGGSDIPYWREFRLGSSRGPIGYPRDFVFARNFAVGELAYEIPVWADLVVIRPSYQAAVYATANDDGFRNSVALRAAVGPEFLRASAGVAAPLEKNFQEIWWTLEFQLGTPF